MIPEFKNKDGTISSKTTKYYENVLSYANKHNLRNTKISIDLAIHLHDGQFRDGELHILFIHWRQQIT